MYALRFTRDMMSDTYELSSDDELDNLRVGCSVTLGRGCRYGVS